jgi:hypothetical protein
VLAAAVVELGDQQSALGMHGVREPPEARHHVGLVHPDRALPSPVAPVDAQRLGDQRARPPRATVR